jgi:hypothetical protein
MSISDDRGQIYTIEGFASALILVGVLFFIFQSISVVTPQTEKSADMKLSQIASDTLICLDRTTEDHSSDLRNTIIHWNGNGTSYYERVSAGEPGIRKLDTQITGMLSSDIGYQVEVSYFNGTLVNTTPVIIHGMPGDNSVVASRLVTLNDNDNSSDYWVSNNRFPQVVEVRLTCWYI